MSRRRAQKGQQGHALGRSGGGFGTKIHLKSDFDGHPLAFDLTGGEAADSPHLETLTDLGPDAQPHAAAADKGDDSASNRERLRQRGSVPVIPRRRTTRPTSRPFARAPYRGRARIEQVVGSLKRFKRIALRCEKTKRNLASFIALAAAFLLVKSVHTAYARWRRDAAGSLTQQAELTCASQKHT